MKTIRSERWLWNGAERKKATKRKKAKEGNAARTMHEANATGAERAARAARTTNATSAERATRATRTTNASRSKKKSESMFY